jgi:hypothetical protein
MFPILPLLLPTVAVAGLSFVEATKHNSKPNGFNSGASDPSLKQAPANSDSSGTRRQLLEMSRSPVF